MTPELLNYIQTLSNRDKKSLSQRGLKTSEEVGEMAKRILPFEGADGTNHRVVARDNVLEEVADVILCALSVAHKLEATTEEITHWMGLKAEKWATIQQRESGAKWPLPFEIHVTVDLSATLMEDPIAEFKAVCADIGVKPIVLDLQDRQGASVMADVMTSSKHFGNNTTALAAAQDIKHRLEMNMFKVTRVKLETVPWHPAAPQDPRDPMPHDCYFEAHIPALIGPGEDFALKQLIARKKLNVHMSQNVFKVVDGKSVIMLTSRSYVTYARNFEKEVTEIISALTDADFEIGKVHTEFALYDTKVSHDASWLLG